VRSARLCGGLRQWVAAVAVAVVAVVTLLEHIGCALRLFNAARQCCWRHGRRCQ
jgi:hypothetical protein